ncbi:MAG: hypothetical protein SNG20_06980, partial [Rikenellaceae bacterium]
MKNLNKYCAFAATLLFMGACTEANVEEAAISSGSDYVLTIPVSTADATDSRVSVDDNWDLTWDEYDAITACNIENTYNAYCIVSELNGTEAVFTSYGYANGSQIAVGDELRIFTPATDADTSEGNHATFDVSSQTSGLTSTVLISDTCYTATESGVMPVVPMMHVGAAVVLDMAFANSDSDYTLLSVDVAGLSSSATVDLCADYDQAKGVSTSTGTISVELAESLSMVMSSAEIKFNIMPSTIAANGSVTVTYNLVDLNNVKCTVTDVITNDGETAVEFARGTYNTLYSTCDMNKLEEVQVPYVVTITSAAANATLSFEINSDLCDAVALAYDVPVASNPYWDIELSYLEGYVVNAEGNYRVITSNEAVSAYPYGDYLSSGTSYGICAVAYKTVDGVNTVVYSEVIYFTTTSAGASTGGDTDTVATITDIEYTATISQISFTITAGDNAAGFNFGIVKASEVNSNSAGDIEAWIESTNWWDSWNPWSYYFDQGSYQTFVSCYDWDTEETLTHSTDYYLFAIPFNSSGVNGTIYIADVSTASLEYNYNMTIDYTPSITATAVSYTFEYGTDCARIFAVARNEDYISGYASAEAVEEEAQSNFFSGYYELSSNNNNTCTYTLESYSIVNNSNYTLYYMAIDNNGCYSEVKTVDFYVPAISTDGTSSITSVDISYTTEDITVAWNNDPTDSTYGYSFDTNSASCYFNGTIIGNAAS